MAQQLLEKIKTLIEPLLNSLGYELWGCTLHNAGGHRVLRVYIELAPDEESKRVAVNLDDCSKVSREVGAVLDVEDIIQGSYDLEISSPGMDRQLFTPAHYRRFIGNVVAVRLLVSEQGRKKYQGTLVDVEDREAGAVIKLQIDNDVNSVLIIPLVNIDKANIIPELYLPKTGELP